MIFSNSIRTIQADRTGYERSKTDISMSWQIIYEQHKKKYDGHIVLCEERYERDYIIKLIQEHYPQFTRARIEAAIKSCCLLVPVPRPRDWFFDCLKNELPET